MPCVLVRVMIRVGVGARDHDADGDDDYYVVILANLWISDRWRLAIANLAKRDSEIESHRNREI